MYDPFSITYGLSPDEESAYDEWQRDQRAQDRERGETQPGVGDETWRGAHLDSSLPKTSPHPVRAVKYAAIPLPLTNPYNLCLARGCREQCNKDTEPFCPKHKDGD